MDAINTRLLKGAKLLGDFWRAGERCPDGWDIQDIKAVQVDGKEAVRHRDCVCEKKTRFCLARVFWINLALDAGRMPFDGEMALPLFMSAEEWDATGLIYNFDHLEVGLIKIGTGVTSQIPMREFVKICDLPDTMASVLKLLKAFPGSKIGGVLQEKKKEEEAPEAESPFPPEEGAQEA